MSNSFEQAFVDFESLLSKWQTAYICSIHSYVAVKRQEGSHLLVGRIFLEPIRDEVNESSVQFETENIVAGRFVKATALDSIAELLENAKAGRMDTDRGPISLLTDSSGSISASFAPIYHPLISDGPRLPSLIIHGINKYELLKSEWGNRQFDWEVKAADFPFDSMDDLLSHCTLPTLTQMGDLSTLEIVARTPAVVGANSVIKGAEAVIECRMAKRLDPFKLRLGYRMLQKDQKIIRSSVTGDSFEWRDDKDLKVAFHRVAIGEASVLQAFLSYDRISLHQWWVTDPQKNLNPWQAIHQIFDQDLDLLRKMLLKPETDKPYAFEGAVSTLLTLLGFSVANYGRIPKLQKGPDIIAFTQSGHVGIVECTVGLINESDKLAKLVQRTALIKEKFADVRYGNLQIQPVVVTPLSREEVAADLPLAGNHGIAVVCKQNIENALSQVEFPPNSDRVFQDTKKLVPAEQPSLFENS
ncbi:hypothetical protein [Nitrospira sp. BLG_2]|uniref:hypothetical protein n=1 Tax=Nitrospira sp. BLG_2 TaxID=3397507 RepID=UPI003B9C1802